MIPGVHPRYPSSLYQGDWLRTINAQVVWDPDGSGPRTPVIVVCGRFSRAGAAVADSLAMFDPATSLWSAMVPPNVGLGESIETLTGMVVMPNNDLVVAGSYRPNGGIHRIARWNGSVWTPLGTGVIDRLRVPHLPDGAAAMVVMPNGDLVIGGHFHHVGGVPANGIARWNGTSWSGFGTANNLSVTALAVMPNGDLVAGGDGGPNASMNPISRWNGSQWSTLGTGVPAGSSWTGYAGKVQSLLLLANGDLAVGGTFGSIGGLTSTCLARWNGTSYAAIPGCTGAYSLVETPAGIVASGATVGLWNGSTWSTLGAESPFVAHLSHMPNGDVLATGSFDLGNGQMLHVARWDGTAWRALGVNWNGPVNALLRLPDDSLVAGGEFTFADGVPAQRLGRWQGSWSELGGGVSHASATARVAALARLANGDLLVGGTFTHAGGTPANNVAVWNGTQWSALGSGLGAGVNAVAQRGNGNIVVGGGWNWPQSCIAEWDGTSWLPVGTGTNGTVNAILAMPNGDLVVGGSFPSAGGVANTAYLARWNGSAWSPLGLGVDNFVSALALLPNGGVAVGGDFSSAGGIPCGGAAWWDGAAWHSLPPLLGGVRALHVAPAGYLIAGGDFLLPDVWLSTFQSVGWCWPQASGSSWNAIPGPGATAFASSGVRAVAMGQQGNLAVGGSFKIGDGNASFAFGAVSCLAPTVRYGNSSCFSPQIGSFRLVLEASPPWIGRRYTSFAERLSLSTSVGIALLGFASASTPLASLHPTGLTNCNLLVQPAVVEIAPQGPKGWSWSFAVPANVALIGVPLFEQIAEMQWNASGQITAIWASDALQTTISDF